MGWVDALETSIRLNNNFKSHVSKCKSENVRNIFFLYNNKNKETYLVVSFIVSFLIHLGKCDS